MLPDYLAPKGIMKFVHQAWQEDHGDGDHTSLGSVPGDAVTSAKLLIKDEGIIAGLQLSKYIFHYAAPDLKVKYFVKDGQKVAFGDVALEVTGNAQKILGAERLVLNCMQRMSGIATYTARMTELIKGTHTKLIDTRKTTPNFRLAEKWAVLIGGGANHRFGLYDMVLLKDNHVDIAGGIRPAIESTVKYLTNAKKELKIEIEIRNLQELEEALATGYIHRVLLDNMLPSDLRQAVKMVNGRLETEASGGITEKNIREIAETGVDYISVGALTHSYRSLDLSLKVIK